MNALTLPLKKEYVPHDIIAWYFLLLIFMLVGSFSAKAQSAALDQGSNDKRTTPVTPVNWVNGNLNTNMAHFLEGYSIPYRIVMKSLVVNKTYTIAIGVDIRANGKNSVDYLTHYQRLEPHAHFGHTAETVNPILNISGFPVSYFTSTDTEPIPVPNSVGADVPGMPATSFNALPAAERMLAGFNADVLSVVYASQGSLSAAASETVVEITFKALKATAVLSWGGHIASVADWGRDPVTGETRSASAISGSPYHTRLKYWLIDGVTTNIGNQDRSVKTDAVFIPPVSSFTGPTNACITASSFTYTSYVDDPLGLTYLWSIIGSNTANAKIVSTTVANAQVVPIGSQFTVGTFNLQLIVTRNGFMDTSYLNSDVSPGDAVTIENVSVNAGADQSITTAGTASLLAIASGSTGTYTYAWSPATNLNNANIANPVFTPPSTGTFQYIVIATSQYGCSGKDTVVITVTQQAKPPCVINGADNICPASVNIYTGPAPETVGSYLWSVTGSGTVSGAANNQTVNIQAGITCGSYVLQLITTTPNGLSKDTCYRTIQITDAIKPVLSGSAANIDVTCKGDIPAVANITASDNCDANVTVQFSQITSDSTCVNKYTITRKWWAVDACGNTSDELIQVIKVNDDVKPVLSGTAANADVTCKGDIPAIPVITASDNCDANVSVQFSQITSDSTCVNKYTITRKWWAVDACGNTSDELIQVIKVNDDVKPVITAGFAAEVNVQCVKDIPVAPAPTAIDNCDGNIAAVYSELGSGSACDSTLTRKWTFTDACGNSDFVTQVIHIKDLTAPVLSGTAANADVTCKGDIPAVPVITASDNCDANVSVQFSQITSDSTCVNKYTITRKWWAVDACGNTSDELIQVIKVNDDVKPVLSGTAANADVTCKGDIPAVPVITASDNCDANVAVQFSQITSDSTCVNKFTITRKWWAVDACGNTSDELIQVIKVNDNVKPVITAGFATEVNVQCVKDIPAPPAPTAVDNCDGNIAAVYSEVGSGTACDSTLTRKWTFTDACGNSDFVTQVIHIKDLTAPVLSGTAANADVTCRGDIPAIPVITASDNCDANVSVQFSQITSDSTCVNKYTITRKWWAVDACGNTSDELIQVIKVNDDVKPVITAGFAAEVNVQCVKDIPVAPAPTAIDNCDGNLAAVYSELGSGSACDSTLTRKWTFTDACGNSDFVTQVIHIKDLTAPVLSGTAANADVTCKSDIPAVAIITASDNCDTNVSVQFSQITSDSTCVNKFTITRKWWAVDACGNTSDELIQVIKVNDNVKPVLSGTAANADVTCKGDIPAVPVITASDNCDANVAVQFSQITSDSTCVNKYTITRKWWAVDACGNTSDHLIQVIKVNDDVKPGITAGFAVEVNVQCVKDIPVAPAPTAVDNCDGNLAAVYSEVGSGTACDSILTRKWTFTDACGNSDFVTQVIHIKDLTAPVLSGTAANADVTCKGDIPAIPVITASDNCDANVAVQFTQITSDSTCVNKFTITRKWWAVDVCGNTSDELIQVIKVNDNVKPVITGTAANADVTCKGDIPAIPVITASDNCDANVSVQFSQITSDSTCVNKYNITRKWWAVDACGNTSDELIQVIKINDNVKPVLSGTAANADVTCKGDIPAIPVITASDNCDVNVAVQFSQITSDSTCVNKYTITRKWWAVDACGNTSDELIQVIKVNDDVKPVITAGFAAEVNIQCVKDIPVAPAPTAIDNCDGNIAAVYSEVGSGSACDSTLTRKWTFTDACGNSDFVNQVIHIKDLTAPVLSGTAANADVTCKGDIPAIPVITASDNCDANVTVQFSQITSDSTCVNKYTITRKWWAVDACGNSSDELIQVIKVNDDVKPVITAGFAVEVNVQCVKDIPVAPAPTAIDNCDGNIAAVYSEVGSGSACDSTLTRKWTFTDACGNSDFVNQVIHIKDLTAPVLSGTAANADVTCKGDIPAIPVITASDNCDANVSVQFSQITSDSTCVNKYTITRKWWAVDACGNSSDELIQVIKVNDDVKPVITAGFAVEVNVQCMKDIPAPPAPTAVDNCDGNIAAVYSEVGSGTACDSTLTRKWTFTDACGNSDFVNQVIHIKDLTAPVLSGTAANADVTCKGDIPAVPVITASDNCDANVSVQFSQITSDSTCVNKYTITRKWWAVDACGNTSDELIQVIKINDNVKPVLSGTAANADVTCKGDIPAVPVITASDNCDANVAVQFSQVTSDSTCVNKFTITRKWWAVDACGNTSDELIQVIKVNDDVKPVITAGFAAEVNVQCVKDIPAAPAPTAIDNCDGNIAAVYSEVGSGSACDSTLTRKWTFTDACGNSDFVTQVIHIKDLTAPVLSGTAPNADVTCKGDIPAKPVITASDNCDANVSVQFSQITSDSTCVNKFTITRKWWAVDACGNTSDELIQVIKVIDDVKPVISAGFAAEVNVQCAKDIPAAPAPTAVDNCDGNIAAVYSEVGSGSACDSTLTRKWTFTDACGNSDFVTQVIHIKDLTAPVLSGTAANADVSCQRDIPAAPAISASDNCDTNVAVQFAQSVSDSTCVNKYTVNRKWWAVDACGNTSDTLTQVIKVHDDAKPVITGSFEKEINVQCVKDIPAPPAPTAVVSCEGSIQAVYSVSGSGSACDSTITRKWTFTDACGNSDFVTQVIHIKDLTAPVLSGTAPKADVTCKGDIPAVPVITASDNCDANVAVQFSQITSDSTCVNKYTITRKWWAVDACGNTSDELIQVIKVNDDVKPVLSGTAANADVICKGDIPAIPVITASDNCDANVTVQFSQITSDSTCVNKYTITRKWWAVDACGNTSDELIQVIKVNDNVKPVISAGFAAEVNVQCVKDIPVAPAPTAIDNCDGNIAAVYSEVGSGSACDSTLTRKWTFTDACGNSDFVTQVIHIKDLTAPVLSGTAANADVTCKSDIPAVAIITASDNCDTNVSVQFSQITSDSTCVNKFTITRKWWAVDACGNTSDELIQVIKVNDNVKPVLSGTAANADATCKSDIPAVPVITASDNCDANVVVQFSQITSDSTCVNKFTITRKWWAVDACGNTSDELIQVIKVNDNVKPVITAGFAVEVNVQCVKDIPAPPAPTAIDNCDGNIAAVYSEVGSGSACDSTLTRKWSFADACGNSDFVTQVIHIKDLTAPVLSGTAANADVTCKSDIPAVPVITASDNCDANVSVQFSQITSDSTCVNKFTITRKWWAVDACGNTSDELIQVIKVNDNVKPVITAGFAAEVNVQCVKDIPVAPAPTAVDNCDGNIAAVYSEVGSGSACDSTLTRKWTFTDACGNSDFVTQVIHIKDLTEPVLSGTAANADVTCKSDIPAVAIITASDNCDTKVSVQFSQITSDSTCVNKFTITRKWWAVDACGNTSDELIQVIKVNDNVKPVLSGTAANADVACKGDIPAVAIITASDNCDANVAVQFSQITSDSTCVNKFTITRKWWAVDACGNTSDELIQVIKVNDNVKPVLSGAAANADVTCKGDIPAVPVITASDNCDANVSVQFSQITSDSTCVNKYTITRKWWAVDACGNTSDELIQVIKVNDDVKPVITAGFAAEVNVQCVKDIPVAPAPTAIDNCDGNLAAVYSEVGSGSACDSTLTRKWTFTDACGNSDFVTQVIHIKDLTAPVLSGTAANADVTCKGDIPAVAIITASDNCDANVAVQFSQITSDSTCVNKFTITRKWWAVDACGNTSDELIQVIKINDNVKPVLSGTAANADVTCKGDIPAVPVITASDNCDANVAVQFSQITSDSTCVNKYTITRKWWAVDACGNTSDELIQVIKVNDDVKPVITAGFAAEVNIQCVKDIPAAPAPTAVDNCDGNIQPVYSVSGSGSACDSTITRKWTFTDACGNSDFVTQVIHIKDLTAPVLSGTAPNADVTCKGDIPAIPVITASDNCDANVSIQFSQITSDSTCVNKFTITRKWWAVDACGNTSDNLIQVIKVNDDVKPVIIAGFAAEVNVQCVKDIPAAPAPTAVDNCNGNIQPVYSVSGSGSACDSTITRKWTFTDACGNSDFVTQVIHMKNDKLPEITSSISNITVSCAKDIPAAPVVSASGNCSKPTIHMTQTTIDSTCVAKFTLVRKWWATDDCGNTSNTLTQTIIVKDNIAPVVTTAPVDKKIACDAKVEFDTPVFRDNCDGPVTVTYEDKVNGNETKIHTRTWKATDACGNSVVIEQRISVPTCETYCAYTQGFYGNTGGNACTIGGINMTAKEIMRRSLDAEPGDSVIFGLKSTGKFYTLYLKDVTSNDIFKMLPGGGKPAALKGYATYTKGNTWGMVPIIPNGQNLGKIYNVMLSQTMTLYFNMAQNFNFRNIQLKGDMLITSRETTCGSMMPVVKSDTFYLPKEVVKYLEVSGQANVLGLYNLANKYLGGQAVGKFNFKIEDVSDAVDVINRAFDGCAVLQGWGTGTGSGLTTQNQTPAPAPAPENDQPCPNSVQQTVSVFPNPYTDFITWRFTAPYSGPVLLEIFNLWGQKLIDIRKANADKCSLMTIEYAVPPANRFNLVYRLSIGKNLVGTGIVVNAK